MSGAEVAAAIVTEIRARREGLAADERHARRFPRSRQILTQRQRQVARRWTSHDR